jgi:hypothetical protein
MSQIQRHYLFVVGLVFSGLLAILVLWMSPKPMPQENMQVLAAVLALFTGLGGAFIASLSGQGTKKRTSK